MTGITIAGATRRFGAVTALDQVSLSVAPGEFVAYVWAPPVSFVVEEADQPGLPGTRQCGALLHHLHEDHVETVLLRPVGMETTMLGPIRHLAYPR